MPCSGITSIQDRFPRLWEKARQLVAKEMLASGWNKHAKKFTEVQLRKARKLLPTLIGV
jgi:hypothetical protein